MKENKTSTPPYKLLRIFHGEREAYVQVYYYSSSKKKYVRFRIPPHLRGATRDQVALRLKEIYRELEKVITYRNNNLIYHEDVKGGSLKRNFTFLDAIEAANELDLPKGRKMAYSALTTIVTEFQDEHKFFYDATPADIDNSYLKEFQAYMKRRNLSGKTINRHLWAIQAISEWLVREKLMDHKIDTAYYHVAALKIRHKNFDLYLMKKCGRLSAIMASGNTTTTTSS